MTDGEKICPDCAETVKAAAKVCRFCGHRFDEAGAQGEVVGDQPGVTLSLAPRKSFFNRVFDADIGGTAGSGCSWVAIAIGMILLVLIGVEQLRDREGAISDAVITEESPTPSKPSMPSRTYQTYKASDFDWESSPEAIPYKEQVVAGVNRLVRENDKCASVETYSLARSVDKFTKTNPVFFIVCNTADGNQFGATFNANKVGDQTQSFAAAKPISKEIAVLACRDSAKSDVARPSTISFPLLDDPSFETWPDGKSILVDSFTAKVGLGVEGKFKLVCHFSGSRIADHHVSPFTG